MTRYELIRNVYNGCPSTPPPPTFDEAMKKLDEAMEERLEELLEIKEEEEEMRQSFAEADRRVEESQAAYQRGKQLDEIFYRGLGAAIAATILTRG